MKIIDIKHRLIELHCPIMRFIPDDPVLLPNHPLQKLRSQVWSRTAIERILESRRKWGYGTHQIKYGVCPLSKRELYYSDHGGDKLQSAQEEIRYFMLAARETMARERFNDPNYDPIRETINEWFSDNEVVVDNTDLQNLIAAKNNKAVAEVLNQLEQARADYKKAENEYNEACQRHTENEEQYRTADSQQAVIQLQDSGDRQAIQAEVTRYQNLIDQALIQRPLLAAIKERARQAMNRALSQPQKLLTDLKRAFDSAMDPPSGLTGQALLNLIEYGIFEEDEIDKHLQEINLIIQPFTEAFKIKTQDLLKKLSEQELALKQILTRAEQATTLNQQQTLIGHGNKIIENMSHFHTHYQNAKNEFIEQIEKAIEPLDVPEDLLPEIPAILTANQQMRHIERLQERSKNSFHPVYRKTHELRRAALQEQLDAFLFEQRTELQNAMDLQQAIQASMISSFYTLNEQGNILLQMERPSRPVLQKLKAVEQEIRKLLDDMTAAQENLQLQYNSVFNQALEMGSNLNMDRRDIQNLNCLVNVREILDDMSEINKTSQEALTVFSQEVQYMQSDIEVHEKRLHEIHLQLQEMQLTMPARAVIIEFKNKYYKYVDQLKQQVIFCTEIEERSKSTANAEDFARYNELAMSIKNTVGNLTHCLKENALQLQNKIYEIATERKINKEFATNYLRKHFQPLMDQTNRFVEWTKPRISSIHSRALRNTIANKTAPMYSSLIKFLEQEDVKADILLQEIKTLVDRGLESLSTEQLQQRKISIEQRIKDLNEIINQVAQTAKSNQQIFYDIIENTAQTDIDLELLAPEISAIQERAAYFANKAVQATQLAAKLDNHQIQRPIINGSQLSSDDEDPLNVNIQWQNMSIG